MPKKSKKQYQNFSAIYTPSYEEIWDDTELISQFDEALREWKAEKLGTLEQTDKYAPDPEDTPTIGPWVAVEPEIYNPELSTETTYMSGLNDFDLLNFYEDALREWREEREPEKWMGIISTLRTPETDMDHGNESMTKPSAWVLVNDEDDGLLYEDAEELIDDLDVVNVYSEALEEWKEERFLDAESEESQSNGGQVISDEATSSVAAMNTETAKA